jgi:hypothetical protein
LYIHDVVFLSGFPGMPLRSGRFRAWFGPPVRKEKASRARIAAAEDQETISEIAEMATDSMEQVGGTPSFCDRPKIFERMG